MEVSVALAPQSEKRPEFRYVLQQKAAAVSPDRSAASGMRQITASRADKLAGIPIGELSRLTGINIETIRYYEKIKLCVQWCGPGI